VEVTAASRLSFKKTKKSRSGWENPLRQDEVKSQHSQPLLPDRHPELKPLLQTPLATLGILSGLVPRINQD